MAISRTNSMYEITHTCTTIVFDVKLSDRMATSWVAVGDLLKAFDRLRASDTDSVAYSHTDHAFAWGTDSRPADVTFWFKFDVNTTVDYSVQCMERIAAVIEDWRIAHNLPAKEEE